MNMIDSSYMPEPPSPLPAAPAALDVKFLVRKFLRGLPIIVVVSALVTAGSYVLLKKLPQKYSSSVSILLDPKKPGSYGAETEFGAAFVDNSKISSVEIVLQSSKLLKEVVDRLHLADNPLYGGYQPSRLSAVVQWLTGQKPPAVPDTLADREGRAIGRLWQMVRPARIGITYVIRLDVTAPNANDAARIAGEVAGAYIDDLTNAKLDAARSDAAWLSDHLKKQREELIKSEIAVASIQQKFGLLGGNAKDDAAVDRQSVGGVNQELIGVEGEVAAVQARYESAEALRRSAGNLEDLPDVADSPVIQDLRRKQAEASQRLATLSAKYSRDFPAVKQAAKEAAELSSLIAQETQRIVNSLKTQYATALAHKNALTAELNRLVGRVTASANAEGREELREAEQVAEANRVAYEASLNKLREVQQQETRLDVEARIISDPDVPSSPSFPRAIQILPAGAALGLLLGVGLVLLLPLGKPKIENAIEVERNLALQVLGTMPFLPASKLTHKGQRISIPDYLIFNPFSAFAESVRLLRYRLRAHISSGGRVIQVTSSVPGEGKSTVAASLAISAAIGHVRTVLIDLDLHRPAAGQLLGNDSKLGVVDFLLGDAKSECAVRSHKNLPIAIISAGSFDTLRPGILESRHLATFISRLRQEYELVIVDTPPVLALSDAVFISTMVDATVLVLATCDTPRAMISKAVDILRASGAPLAGVLLNKVSQSDTLTYGSEKYSYYTDWAQETQSLA